MAKPEDLLLVGRIGGAHGLRGQVRLESFMRAPEMLGRIGSLFDSKAGSAFEVTLLRRVKANLFIAKIEGVETRSKAEALTNTGLYLDRFRLPKPEADEFYYADLIGLRVEDLAARLIGCVAGVSDFGAGDILHIKRPDGEELLLPFTRKVVQSVELPFRLVVELPIEVEVN